MIGRQLGGRYEILERVGGGGMAIVYKGLDILLHRHVAVKILRQQYVHDEEFIQRFRREAQAAASLSHPNVVSIYDVGQEDDVHYIVMEYIEGTTLNDRIKEKAPLQVEEAVHIAGQICDALDHAHHNQIIHRDIKPHNILIGKNGRVKVTDFGIARAVTSSTITQTGSVVGSVHYFSPEHAKGTTTGEQSDLYSLGIVMYQMLTGRLPFLGESPISVALKHLQEDVEEPRKVNPLIPQSVENIILRAMRKSTAERYRSAKEMLGDLESCLQPHRRGEPKVSFFDDDDMDEERTRVMPAIRPGQYEISAVEDDEPPKPAASENPPEKKKGGWVKPVMWLLVLAVMVGGMWYLVRYVQAVTTAPEDVMVPDLRGRPVAEARQTLESLGLGVDIEPQSSTEVPKETVILQDKANMKIRKDSRVKLTVSTGPPPQKMPDLKKLKLADAKTKLLQLGIKAENIKTDDMVMDEEPGLVLTQTPAANAEFTDPAATQVTLGVSKGPETIPMPNLIGLSENEAKNKILVNKLKIAKDGVSYQPNYKLSQGKVISQFPYQPDEVVAPGTEISLTVSSGLPKEAGQMAVNVPVRPAKEGAVSTVKIILTDASRESVEYQTLTGVDKLQTFQVNVVVSPEQNASIQIKADNTVIDVITVTYEDFKNHGKSGKPFTPGTGTGAGTAEPGGAAGSTTAPSGTTGTGGNGTGTGGTGAAKPGTETPAAGTQEPAGTSGNTTGTGGQNP
ncbi:serine/threonine protein kinase with PASTA sensor [Paenibacillus mucilaginosus 3016]|uniref:Serine/threonine-protein kinase PrkC n=1 Tax=Paenibacillus mucilaginosus 3016 TaxID=1116391 RepID=H6NQW1_9BACL|nr:Stk1 family PASTA domain-containing Ser/Thr kinase [Paenibacillus mucilaginosus]AFC31954.1 serine/threonine protein kinase with PASTA sensor [Paenibacillus mucilaginosus 3016]WFA20467.1 Stk1 family PASTA domain-containing Ser/Thr kinase [Paenibacillus mucilaginosus]